MVCELSVEPNHWLIDNSLYNTNKYQYNYIILKNLLIRCIRGYKEKGYKDLLIIYIIRKKNVN